MNFNYHEDEILQDAFSYIQSTYGQHYAGDRDIQLFDYWESLGILTPVAIGTAMKYLARFGKKEGANKKDLLKAIHYTVLALYSEFYSDQREKEDDPVERTRPTGPTPPPDEDAALSIESSFIPEANVTIEEFIERLARSMMVSPDSKPV